MNLEKILFCFSPIRLHFLNGPHQFLDPWIILSQHCFCCALKLAKLIYLFSINSLSQTEFVEICESRRAKLPAGGGGIGGEIASASCWLWHSRINKMHLANCSKFNWPLLCTSTWPHILASIGCPKPDLQNSQFSIQFHNLIHLKNTSFTSAPLISPSLSLSNSTNSASNWSKFSTLHSSIFRSKSDPPIPFFGPPKFCGLIGA